MGINIDEGSFLDNVLSTILDGMIVIDKNAQILYLNKMVETMFGYSEKDLLGKNIKMLMPEKYSKNHDQYIASYMNTGKAKVIGSTRSVEGKKKDGTIFFMEFGVSTMVHEGEAIFIGIVRDLTESVKTQHYLEIISKIQEMHIKQIPSKVIFADILKFLLDYSGSEYGFIGGFYNDDKGRYLRIYTITDISWNKETKKLYDQTESNNFVFRNLKTLFGYTIEHGKQLVTNDAPNHPLSSGIPHGHPPLKTYAGIPIIGSNDNCIGMVGLANREGGYSDSMVNDLLQIVYVISTIIESDRNMEYIKDIATIDFLSKAYNRHFLQTHLQDKIKAFNNSKGSNKDKFCVFMVDINNFKNINDYYGHDFGDFVIKELSLRLQSIIKLGDIVARIGGDEFLIVCNNLSDDNEISGLAKRISDAGKKKYIFDGQQIVSSASIGICKFKAYMSIESLHKYADLALYKSKFDKIKYCFFTDEIKYAAEQQRNLDKILRRAFNERLFYLIYQPQVDLKSKKLIGFEALLRYDDKNYSTIQLIEHIYKTSLSERLNKYILYRFMEDTDSLEINNIKISLNITPKVKKFREHLKTLTDSLSESKFAQREGNSVEFELTETSFIEDIKDNDVEYISTLMSDNNITLAIDDFGVEHSSISRLVKYSMSVLKIDISFIQKLTKDKKDKNYIIVDAIINLAKKLNIETIAEGVESIELQNLVHDLGCDQAQGYLYSKGLRNSEITDFIQKFKN